MRKRLVLAKETLAELSADDLAVVVGGAPDLPTMPDLGACLTFKGSHCIYV